MADEQEAGRAAGQMGILIKAFFAALLVFTMLLVVAQLYIPSLGELAAQATGS